MQWMDLHVGKLFKKSCICGGLRRVGKLWKHQGADVPDRRGGLSGQIIGRIKHGTAVRLAGMASTAT